MVYRCLKQSKTETSSFPSFPHKLGSLPLFYVLDSDVISHPSLQVPIPLTNWSPSPLTSCPLSPHPTVLTVMSTVTSPSLYSSLPLHPRSPSLSLGQESQVSMLQEITSLGQESQVPMPTGDKQVR